jgi:hypothetical protein
VSEKPPPDFAMLRAVEIMAKFVEKQRAKPPVPPAPLDGPVFLFNETQPLEIGKTTREQCERAFGTGFPFPAQGWHSYAMRHDGAPALLSLFYQGEMLVGAEHYYMKGKTTPALAPRNLGSFRIVPGEIELGYAFAKLPDDYVPAIGGPGAQVYMVTYEARYPGGVAYLMGNDGKIERIVLYIDKPR